MVLESDHFLDYPITHLDRSDKDKEVEDQLEQKRPYNGCRVSIRINRRVLRQHRIDDTGKDNNDTLQAHPGIRLQELTSDLGCAFACKRRKRDRGDSGVHKDLKNA